MRTLEEVKKYLRVVGHDQQSIRKIEGFLIGQGMLNNEDWEMTYEIGENDFDSFYNWFNDENICLDESNLGKGDFIHVEDGMDVLCLSSVFDGEFVGTQGTIIHKFKLTKGSRPCYEDEISKVEEALKENGVSFCFDCDELEPTCENKENDIPSECIDCLEMQCKQAIENISASLHGEDLSKEERNSLIDALNVLVALGKEYE